MTFNPENLIFIPLFLIFIIILITLAGFLSGWFFIAKKNPLPVDTGRLVSSVKGATVNINYIAAYRGLINIDVTENGILFKPVFFMLMHPRMFIHWDKIKNISYRSGYFERVIFFAEKTRFAVFGYISKEIINFQKKY